MMLLSKKSRTSSALSGHLRTLTPMIFGDINIWELQ